jgi:hypothetical protein
MNAKRGARTMVEKRYVDVGGERPLALRYDDVKQEFTVGGNAKDREAMERVGGAFKLELVRVDPVRTQVNKIRFTLPMKRLRYMQGLDALGEVASARKVESLGRIMY